MRDGNQKNPDEIEGLCLQILSYLADNPNSRDTLEGIAEWWLSEQDFQPRREQLRGAVVRLVAEEFLIERRGPDGREHYLANPTRHGEIGRRIARRHTSGSGGSADG